MAEIILHIGTPKTGTTAIQAALSANIDALDTVGIAFLKTGRHRAAHNDLANGLRRNGADHEFKDALNKEFELECANRPQSRILLSSELFSLIDATKVRDALPFLSHHPMKIIVYLRRQDDYAEAFYKQKIKNGRSVMPFEQFLSGRLGRSITDYNTLLDNWTQVFENAEIIPRVYQRDQFVDGDIIADFASLLQIEPSQLSASQPERNVSPSKDVIDILLALSPHLKGRQLRDVFRAMKAQQLDGFSGSGDLFTNSERRDYLSQFSDANEHLRKTYFPAQKQLFHPVDRQNDKTGSSGFSPEQLMLLQCAVKEAFSIQAKTNYTSPPKN